MNFFMFLCALFNVKLVPSLTALLYNTLILRWAVYSFTNIVMSSIVISSPW